MADRDAERRAALDKALRDMMRAAGTLPVPEDLLSFVEALVEDDEDDADAAE